jgi:hypothetical protein
MASLRKTRRRRGGSRKSPSPAKHVSRRMKIGIGLAVTMLTAYLLYAKVITQQQIDAVKESGGNIVEYLTSKAEQIKGLPSFLKSQLDLLEQSKGSQITQSNNSVQAREAARDAEVRKIMNAKFAEQEKLFDFVNLMEAGIADDRAQAKKMEAQLPNV